MEIAVTIARLLLSAVFALAGFSKVIDRSGTRQAALGFGVPQRFAAPVAVIVPIVELAVAAALVPAVSAWHAAWTALGLLITFTAAIGYQLARGRALACHCFGQVSHERIGWPTLVRNLVLCAMALVVLSGGRTHTALSSEWGYSDVTTTLLVALTSIALILWRQQGQLAQRLRELEADLTGTAELAHPHDHNVMSRPAPEFVLPDLNGRQVSLDDLLSGGRSTVLVFSDPDCRSCTSMRPQLDRWRTEHAGVLNIVVISRGAPGAKGSTLDGQSTAPVLLQRHREVAEAYRVPGTPCAVVVNPDRRISGDAVCGESEIGKLIGEHAAAGQSPVAPIGAQAPAFSLPDLDGNLVTLDDLRGTPTLLLFWNPECGHCEAMLPALRDWETRSDMDGTRLVLISTDDLAANRALGLSSRILLDKGFTTASAFGIGGTPMAIRLDEDTRVASGVASGAQAFWVLLARLPDRSPPAGS